MKVLELKKYRLSLRMTLTVAAVLVAPLQYGHGAEPASGNLRKQVKTVRRDLDRVAYLTDSVTKKLETLDPAVCAGGKELERLGVALHKMNSDYAALTRLAALEAPALHDRVQEEAQAAAQIMTFFNQADLKSSCMAAAGGTSAKAIAHMSITLQVTRKDAGAERTRTLQLEREAVTQSAYASQNL